MVLPSAQEIEFLHKKYAPSKDVYNIVFTHSQAVCDIAAQLISKGSFEVNIELVKVGCMLHDIGVYLLLGEDGETHSDKNYITHGIEGEVILKKEGFPELIWRFASHHTGVGLSSKDIAAQKLPLPLGDYLARSDEELLVMYADKFHSKTTPPYFNSFEWYRQDISKFGYDKVDRFEQMAQRFGVPSLAPLKQKYGFEIR